MIDRLVRVVGLDLASKHTGMISMTAAWSNVDNELLIAYHQIIETAFHLSEDSTNGRIDVSTDIVSNILSYSPELVCMEDYTRQSTSYDSYSVAELSGMVRYKLFVGSLPTVFVAPIRLKAFLNNQHYKKTPLMKREVATAVSQTFSWASGKKDPKEREDCTDAFVLAMMAFVINTYEKAEENEKDLIRKWLSAKQSEVLFGKSSGKGLMNEENIRLRPLLCTTANT